MRAYFENTVGFFIQLLPCALMVFLPFPLETYRIRRKYVFTAVTAVVALIAVAFPFVLSSTPPEYAALAANVFMFLSTVLVLVFYAWVIQEAAVKKILSFFIVLFYAALQYCLVNGVTGLLYGLFHFSSACEPWAVYTPAGVVVYFLTGAFLIPLMYVFVLRVLRSYLQEVETQQMKREFFILIISTAAFAAIMMSIDMTYYYLDYSLYLSLLVLVLVLLLDQVFIYWLVLHGSVWRKQENERMRAAELQQLQYERIVSDMESTRRMRHDLRHHYNALNDMLDREQYDDMKAYLSEVIGMTVRRDTELYCNNLTVNGLLQYYAGIAKNEGIHCEIQAICDTLPVEAVDLTILLGNAMENAIHACRKYPGTPWIRAAVGIIQGSLAIQISNSCKEVHISRQFRETSGFLPAEAFLSGRKGGGMGLRSIAHTARKYNGSSGAQFDAEKETFTTRIRLTLQGNYD